MKTPALFAVAATLVLASCSTVVPVTGQMQRSEEPFSGSLVGGGHRSGPGELTIVLDRKTTCRGSVVYISRSRADGVLNCDDGRSGPFHVAGFGDTGSGYGDLAGQRFTFTFGKSS